MQLATGRLRNKPLLPEVQLHLPQVVRKTTAQPVCVVNPITSGPPEIVDCLKTACTGASTALCQRSIPWPKHHDSWQSLLVTEATDRYHKETWLQTDKLWADGCIGLHIEVVDLARRRVQHEACLLPRYKQLLIKPRP